MDGARADGRGADSSARPAWAPEEIDVRRPSVARVYDVHLGGAHNFAVDREAAAEIARAMPELPELFRANRSFLRRAVKFLVDAGITQFLDLGSGIPTVGNVHEIAQRADPASRVAYVDIDPVAVLHSQHILAGNPRAVAVRGDLRQPAEVLADPTVRDLLDFTRPIAVLMVAVLHFVPDDDRPADIVAGYLRDVPAGSYLALSHPTHGDETAERSKSAAAVYSRIVRSIHLRDRQQVAALLAGLDLVDPGLVYVNAWRPDEPGEALNAERLPQIGGVARKS